MLVSNTQTCDSVKMFPHPPQQKKGNNITPKNVIEKEIPKHIVFYR
jgi:hypothetical protein